MQHQPGSVRELVDQYLDTRLSRRGFLGGLSRWGFSVAAAASMLDSLAPLAAAGRAQAVTPGAASSGTTVAEGTGGELLVEQLRAAGHTAFNFRGGLRGLIEYGAARNLVPLEILDLASS